VLLATAIIFVFLAIFNRIKTTPIYPGFVFCASWAVSLLILIATNDLFYRLAPQTLVVFICGGLVVTLACALGSISSSKPPSPVDRQASNRILTAMLWLVVLATPVFLVWLWQAVAAAGGNAPLLGAARMLQVNAIESGDDNAFRAAFYLILFSQSVAVLCLWEKKGHERRATVAIVFALILSIPFGQKAGPFSLVIALICVDWIRNRRMRWKLITVTFLAMLCLTAIVEFYVHLGGSSDTNSVARMIGLYVSGGIIGFDQVVRDPSIVTHINPVDILGLRIARRLGNNVVIPEVYGYANIGPYGLRTNVYTIFWPLMNWGWLANMCTIGFIFFSVTRVYKRALQGGMPWVQLYAAMLFGVVFSTFTEYFIPSLYIYSVLIATNWIVYSLPVRITQFKIFNRNIVYNRLRSQEPPPVEIR